MDWYLMLAVSVGVHRAEVVHTWMEVVRIQVLALDRRKVEPELRKMGERRRQEPVHHRQEEHRTPAAVRMDSLNILLEKGQEVHRRTGLCGPEVAPLRMDLGWHPVEAVGARREVAQKHHFPMNQRIVFGRRKCPWMGIQRSLVHCASPY